MTIQSTAARPTTAPAVGGPVVPGLDQAVSYCASVVLPYRHLDGATAGLRAELRHQVVDRGFGAMPDWNTLVVTGPWESTDRRGRPWYEYRASIDIRRSADGS